MHLLQFTTLNYNAYLLTLPHANDNWYVDMDWKQWQN